MPTSRSYGDACAIARALDVVGERWALLIARELLLGPQRFSDLRHGLPGASSNLVADRLRELEGRGVIGRRKLPAPASSRVYELTQRGRDLEPILLALGDWGMHVPLPPAPATLSATSVLLFLRSSARPDPEAPPATCRLELDDRVWTARAEAGRLHVQPGEPANPDASLRAEPATLSALLDGSREFDAALSDGTIAASGHLPALRQLIQAVTAPFAAQRRGAGLADDDPASTTAPSTG
jgi:DNA-binding HxlR family transcriptional regulator